MRLRSALSAGAALALWTAPLAAAQPEAMSCGADRYACAAEAYRTGDADRARPLVDELIRADPSNADALLLSGLLWMRAGRLDYASAALDRALAAAPDYPDVLVARARLRLRRNNRAAAMRDLNRALAVAPGQPDALALRTQMAAEPKARQWTASLGHSISRLSPRRAGGWHETLAALSRRSARSSFSLEAEHARRFGDSDIRLQLRADVPLGRGTVYAGAVATIDPDFRESWGLRAGAAYPAAAGIDLLLDGRFSSYGDASSGSVATGARVWLARRRASVRAAMIQFVDERGDYRTGFAGDGAAEIGSGVRVQAGYARYPETEAGVTRRVETAFAGAAYQLSPTLTLRAGIEREVRRRTYRRDSATAGVTFAF